MSELKHRWKLTQRAYYANMESSTMTTETRCAYCLKHGEHDRTCPEVVGIGSPGALGLRRDGIDKSDKSEVTKVAKAEKRPYDVMSAIIDYESGELSEDAVIELFQHLVDTGMAWQLQGSYGRTARALIQAGEIEFLVNEDGSNDI
jgi:hypothetical protein